MLGVNYFLAKAHLAIVYYLLHSKRLIAAGIATVVPIAGAIAAIAVLGQLTALVPQGFGIAARLGNSIGAQFLVALVGGSVSFGGAYTAVPFMQYETVTSGAWVVNQVFLDSLAVCALLPAPLVTFVVLIGYVAGGVGGALVMAFGMFLPALIMPIALHTHLDSLVRQTGIVAVVLDGIAATTVGMIAVTAVTLLRTAVTVPLDAVIFIAALQALYSIRSPWAPVYVVLAAGAAGYVLFY